MIIFRKIRVQMLNKNKIGKYMVYAFGEIILVVIGILIALNVNNWNEINKNIKKSNEFVIDLKNDIKKDTLIFGDEIRKINYYIDYKTWGLNVSDFNEVNVDYLAGLTAIGYHNIELNTGTYIRMQNSNIWDLNEYKELFKSVDSYYIFYKTYLDNFNDWEQKLYRDEFVFWNAQNIFEIQFAVNDSIPIIQNEIIRKKKIIELISSIKGRNYLNINLMREKYMRDTYTRIYDKAQKLLEEIDDLQENKG